MPAQQTVTSIWLERLLSVSIRQGQIRGRVPERDLALVHHAVVAANTSMAAFAVPLDVAAVPTTEHSSVRCRLHDKNRSRATANFKADLRPCVNPVAELDCQGPTGAQALSAMRKA